MPVTDPTVNLTVRDALALRPFQRGTRIGTDILPDYAITQETASYIVTSEQSLSLDDLRAEGALAKEVVFDPNALATIVTHERMQKSTIDKRRVELDRQVGVDALADRAEFHRTDIEDIKEFRIATLLTTAVNYPVTHRLAGQNFGAAGIKTLIDTGRDLVLNDGGHDLTGMEVGISAWRRLQVNPDIIAFAGTTRITPEIVAEYFELPVVKIGRFSRRLANTAVQAAFWPVDTAVLYSVQKSLSNRTLGVNAVVPYGADFNRAGVITDVRTSEITGVEGLVEVAACQRYQPVITNQNLGYIFTGIV